MSGNNEEPEIVEDQNDVELGLNDLNKPPVCDGPLEPCLGMEFEDVEDARACYNAYARRKGFSIRINHTRLSKEDKSLVGVEYVCSREGFRHKSYKKKERVGPEPPETRIGCKAMMCLKKVEETWIVSKFEVNHNHELLSPESTSLLRGHRVISRAQKKLIDKLNESGVPPRKIMSVLSKEPGGDYNVGCIAVNVQNYVGNKRRKLLDDGDAQKMYNYFIESQCKNPGFVYAIQVDENGCMGNCFWADAKSRIAYQYFGDVVTFDATYLTNCYRMPFVPFTGVNHHHQSVMFGCALVVNKTVESYTWLLKTWLEAMFGRAPSTIITDDDNAMGNAIAKILPNTTHKLCMWHILEKVPEHLAHMYYKYPSFQREFHHCIHDIVTIEEFELEWSELVEKYDLRDNDWLRNLYMRREKWVPAYIRRTFCAGMSTTQRSVSMNTFFKDYVRSNTVVGDFVYQYEEALNACYLKEKEKDVKTKTSMPSLKTCYKMEAEAAKVYSRKLFLIFQEELFCSQKYKASKDREEGMKKIYKVVPHGKESPIYEVSLETTEKKAICTCHMFEFIGILCRHILTIFVKKSLVDFLPPHYILERWTINAKHRIIHDITGDVMQVEPQISSTLMRNSLMLKFLEVAEVGSQSTKKYKHLDLALQKVHDELLAMYDESDENANMELQKHPKENQPMKRKCSICKKADHVRSNCPSYKQSRDVANTSLTQLHLDSIDQQSLDKDSLPTMWNPATTSLNMPQDPRSSSFTDFLLDGTHQQFQKS